MPFWLIIMCFDSDGLKNWWKDASNEYWWKYTNFSSKKVYKHKVFIYVWGIYSTGHEFGVFKILPKYHLYS
jgi:hypothetical protein